MNRAPVEHISAALERASGMAVVITGCILQDLIQVAGEGLPVKIAEHFAGICNMTRVTAEETGMDDGHYSGFVQRFHRRQHQFNGLLKVLLQRMPEQGVGRACIAGRMPVQRAERLLQHAGFFGPGAG